MNQFDDFVEDVCDLARQYGYIPEVGKVMIEGGAWLQLYLKEVTGDVREDNKDTG